MKDDKDTRRRLLAFLDRELFDPIINTPRSRYHTKEDEQRFDDARRKIEDEKRRYHECATALDIKESFLSDLQSRTAQRLSENLRHLGLPSYADVRDDFLKLCATYGL